MSTSTVTVTEVPARDLSLVAGVAGRGMRDIPTHFALYGGDADRREACHTTVMLRALEVLGWPVLGAYDSSGALVGIAGSGKPGTTVRSNITAGTLLTTLLSTAVTVTKIGRR